MSSTPTPTGRREERNGTSYVVLTRTFRAPIDGLWAALTEPARMERWVGTYLDRLMSVQAGAAVDSVVWDDYYPAMSEHYRAAFS